MQILEDHNKQLESQLHRLRELLLQVVSEQGSGEKPILGVGFAITELGQWHNGMVKRWGGKGHRIMTTCLLSPASSRVRWQRFSSLFLGFISTSV